MTATESADRAAPSPAAPTQGGLEVSAASAFSLSVVISGIRCLLAYIVFPWLLPLFGVARGTGPAVGLAVGVVAIAFNIASIRRFSASSHPWRGLVIALNITIIVLLGVLVVIDVNALI